MFHIIYIKKIFDWSTNEQIEIIFLWMGKQCLKNYVKINVLLPQVLYSPADMCSFWYNRASNGKDAKFGTNKTNFI